MITDKYTLDEQEAFLAMRHFLIKFWRRTTENHPEINPENAQLATLLADITILKDGHTQDPVAWEDWLKSIDSAKKHTPDELVRD